MPRVEDYSGATIEAKFESMFEDTNSPNVASGKYILARPIRVPDGISLNCTGATFDGSALSRSGGNEAIFQLQPSVITSFVLVGGTYNDAHLLRTTGASLGSLDIDIERHERLAGTSTISIITNGAQEIDVASARVRCRESVRTSPLFSTTFGGGDLVVQLDQVTDLHQYGVRLRPPTFVWDRIVVQNSIVVGNADNDIVAVRFFQASAADLVTIRNVTMSDFSNTGFVSFVYWSGGDCLIHDCTISNITSGGDENLIESKSVSDHQLKVFRVSVDQSAVDPSVSQNRFIDAKERTAIVHDCTTIGLTSSFVRRFGHQNGLPTVTARIYDNTIINSRCPVIFELNNIVSMTLGDTRITNNTITGHANPCDIDAAGSSNTRMLDITSASGRGVVENVVLDGNLYTSSNGGACAAVRVNAYSAEEAANDFTFGQQVREIVLRNNKFTLPGGAPLQCRNAYPGLFRLHDNHVFGADSMTWNDSNAVIAVFPAVEGTLQLNNESVLGGDRIARVMLQRTRDEISPSVAYDNGFISTWTWSDGATTVSNYPSHAGGATCVVEVMLEHLTSLNLSGVGMSSNTFPFRSLKKCTTIDLSGNNLSTYEVDRIIDQLLLAQNENPVMSNGTLDLSGNSPPSDPSDLENVGWLVTVSSLP